MNTEKISTASADKFVREYARQMESDKALALKRPEEWDFRPVTDDELPLVIQYEYLRENDAFRGAALALLESKVKGKSVRSLLLGHDYRIDSPGADGYALDWTSRCFLQQYPLFPLPWLSFEEEDTRGYAKEVIETRKALDHAFRQDNKDSERVGWRMLPCLSAYPLATIKNPKSFFGDMPGCYMCRFDFSAHKTNDILADFEIWLRSESKKGKRLSGRASLPPWHKLRELSARRLDKAGLKWKPDERKKVEATPGHPPVWKLVKFGDAMSCWRASAETLHPPTT